MKRLTYTQQGIYNDSMLYEGKLRHTIGGYIALKGHPDREILEEAIRRLIGEQTALRTRIIIQDGCPYQCIERESHFVLQTVEINEQNFPDHVQRVFQETVEVTDYPLYFFQLCYLNEGGTNLIIRLHHIIADGWSMEVATKQISRHYHNVITCANPSMELFQFQNLIGREDRYMESDKVKQANAFYQDVYKSIRAFKEAEREKSMDFTAFSSNFQLDYELSAQVRFFCERHRLSLNMLFTAVFGLALTYLNQNKIVYLGLPIYGRNGIREKNTMGMYTNILPFIVEADGGESFLDYVFQTKKRLTMLYKYAKYPFSSFLQSAPKDAVLYKYTYTMNYYNMQFCSEFCGLPAAYHEVVPDTQPYDLQMKVYDWGSDGYLRIGFDYRISIYSKAAVSWLFEMLNRMIKGVLKNPEKRLDQLIEFGIEEDKWMLSRLFNWERAPEKNEGTLGELFARQVAHHPEQIAVIDIDRQYDYGELNTLVHRYLSLFHQRKLKQGDVVAFHTDHSVFMLAALLAAVWAGIVFLPLDKSWPKERKKGILKETDPRLILTDGSPVVVVDGDSQFRLSDIENTPIFFGEMLAQKDRGTQYILYTSGSSGRPKGVVISNEALYLYVCWAIKAYFATSKDVFALYTSLAFDLTLSSIFIPLCSGGTVKIFRQAERHPLLDIVSDSEVTMVKVTPSHLHLINDGFYENSRIRAIIVGGEQLLRKTAEKTMKCFAHSLSIYNEYGPTEATIGCMCYQVNSNCTGAAVPIGMPINHAAVCLMNENGQILGKYAVGEICIAGPCLAEGYYLDKELTDQKFVTHPSFFSRRIYKTGDLAMINADNEMVYLGRADRQVKIRGYRVELDEISSNIMGHEAVSSCVTMLLGTVQTQCLCAFVVLRTGEVVPPEIIRAFAAQSLPNYMVPDEVFYIDKIPLTQNGKIDEHRLKIKWEELRNRGLVDRPHAPQNQQERVLHKAASCVLGIYNLDMQKSFSDLGGDSIKAILLLQRLERENYHLDIKEILAQCPLYTLSARMTTKLSQRERFLSSYGPVPLSPVIRRFIKTQNVRHNTCFHSVHLLFRQAISEQRLLGAISCLLRTHRSLTLNLSKDGGTLFYNPCHLEDEPVLFKCASEDVYRFNLYNDLLVRVILNGNACEIVINHLVIDYVSWQILLQDLHYLLSGSEIQELPYEMASYGEFASDLMTQLGTGLFERQRTGTDTLRKMYSYEREGIIQRTWKRAENNGESLPQWIYQQLAQSASEYFGLAELEIELENTGREQMDPRYWHTVGWFTSFSYVLYRNSHFSHISQSGQILPVMRFNYLGHATEQYEIFSVVPLKEELLRYKIEDTLEYFMQVECLAASDACLSFCLSVDPASPVGSAIDAFMEYFFYRLDIQLERENNQDRPTYIDEGISAEDLAMLMSES